MIEAMSEQETGNREQGSGISDQSASFPSADSLAAINPPTHSSNTEAGPDHNATQAAPPSPLVPSPSVPVPLVPSPLVPVPCIPSDGALPQLESAPLAYENSGFLNSADGRLIRIVSEYMEPLARFRREQI